MSIRRTIILLTVPLFLALALVNGALLYFQEKAELSQALAEQALAAAITSAEFISAMERPEEELATPVRAKALQAAAKHVDGLDGLYLIQSDAHSHALVPASRPWSLDGLERPEEPHARPVEADSNKYRYVVALAPVAGGGFVAARIDAEPMLAQMATIQRAILLIVAAAGVIATALAWFVARRIVRELERNREAIVAIGAGKALEGDSGLTIREARDLAGAVRLMEASSRAAAERSRRVTAHRDRERTVATALAASRDALFGPVSTEAAGAQVAARICGDAAPGSFFALCADEDRAIVVLGRCSGASPQEAFARAIAARRFLESNMFTMASDDDLDRAKSEHAVEELQFLAWIAAEPPSSGVRLLTLTDIETTDRAAGYAERNRDAAPGELLDAIELLLEPVGLFAAVSR